MAHPLVEKQALHHGTSHSFATNPNEPDAFGKEDLKMKQQYTTELLRRRAESHMVRTLDERIPELKPYLKPGVKVLDVGCGVGSITLDVAQVVKPGEVVGIEPVEYSVQVACQLAKDRKVSNVSFEVGDSLSLRFPDDTFDIVYSYTVLHYFYDPERAVREQKRVTKKGGWVIAAGVRDAGLVRRYPPCPAWENVIQMHARYVDSRRDQPKLADLSCGQMQAARRCPEYFIKAGLKDLELQVKQYNLEYPGVDGMEPNVMDLLPWDGPDVTGNYASWERDYKAMVAEGFISEETLKEAMEEAQAWYKNPHAFHFHAYVFAAGRA